MKQLLFLLVMSCGIAVAQDVQRVSIGVKGATAIGFSPDNQYLLIARGNKPQLYHAGNDTRIKEFIAEHTRDILNIAFNRAGNLLLTASADKTVKLWQVPEGTILNTYNGLPEPVIGVHFGEGEKTILAIGEGGTLASWERSSGKLIFTKKDFEKPVRAFDVTQDGKYIAAGGADRVIHIYDASTGYLVKKLEGHKGWIRSLAFSPDGKTLASGSDDKMVFIWDVANGEKARELPQKGWIYDLEFSSDGKYLGMALEKNAIHFYTLSTGLLSLKLEDFKAPVVKIAMSPNGRQVSGVEEFGTEVTLSTIASLNIVPVVFHKDEKDTSAPLVLIANPPNIIDNRVVLYTDLIDMRGVVSDESGIYSLKINGLETPVRQNGNFIINIPLALGDNFITMEVTDVNDNIALKKFIIVRKNPDGEPYIGIKATNHLFVVGIDNYQHWPHLNNAVKDANDLVSVMLNTYTFDFSNVTIIRDEQATRNTIYNGLRSLIEKVGSKDNLIVYFSGHGHFDPVLNEGYWIPIEANPNSTGEYISNSDILKILGAINSQHTFLIADACFSGALFTDSRRGYTEQVEKFRSRWGLASGRLETVSDGEAGTNSPFARRLLQFLKENEKEKFPVSELIQYVKTQVAEDTNQTPIGNPLKALGDEGGEMVFYKRSN